MVDLRTVLNTHFEWLAVYAEGRAFPLRRDEIEHEEAAGKTLIGLHAEKGFRSWRVNKFEMDGNEIVLEVSGKFGAEPHTIRLIPRTSAAELSREIELARLLRANSIAKLIEPNFPDQRLVRVSLNEPGGRMAHILVEARGGKQTAILADVTDKLGPETLMVAAFTWLDHMNARRKKPVEGVWIIAPKKQASALRRLHTLLNRGARSSITIIDMKDEKLNSLDEWPLSALWREKPRQLSIPSEVRLSRSATVLVNLLPEKIDVIRSKQGETVRFHGMPFARVRTMMGKERAWFGTGSKRRPLGRENFEDLEKLIAEIDDFRRFEKPVPRHEHYRASPEWWLESILKRDIQKLDANLILSPIYNQFRSSTDKIDLLALRRDGRLVIVELKTSPDREMAFQAADYWRKIELQRRRGVLAKARLFGDLEILDKPAIVYLVSPALSIHRDVARFSRMLTTEIELWMFELHEEWRNEIKVIARTGPDSHAY
jgi:hypothetical protein